MADAVTNRIVHNGTRTYIVQLTNVSDGSGESAVKKVDLTNLVMKDGNSPDAVSIEKVSWDVGGFTNVVLYWDRNPSAIVAVTLSGQGEVDYREEGNIHDPKHDQDGSGDILLTTNGATSGDTYNITLQLKLKRTNS